MKWNCAIKLQASRHYIFELQFMFVTAVYMRYKKKYKNLHLSLVIAFRMKMFSNEFYDFMIEKTNSYNKHWRKIYCTPVKTILW